MGQESGRFPVDCLAPRFRFRNGSELVEDDGKAGEIGEIRDWLTVRGLVATERHKPFPGQIARVKIDVYGASAMEVHATLMEYAPRCDSAAETSECSYGQTVIERNLEVADGELYSWKGRITLHPSLGREPFVPAGRLRDGLED